MFINPIKDIGSEFLSVTNPARYIGGEFGQCIKESSFKFVIGFPDLYEIAMSNQAIKIIYNGINSLDDISCERVFAPDVDFENLLKQKNVPLFTLESYMPLCEADIIGFSVGYELGINGLLAILETGKVPLLSKERGENDPIVIAGGCGMTNPAPFSDFIDAAFIGEAEDELFFLVEKMAKAKKNGAKRKELLSILKEHPNVWVKGKKASRAIFSDFATKQVGDGKLFKPVANLRVVQDHGVSEIMRGCPNGCRFCHAGIYYRPQRAKPFERIIDEVDKIIYEGGYREISLNSLSSGDYTKIEELLDILHTRYEGEHISFQLPSLKVNSLTLPIIEKLSKVRKSGLTFAIETPVDQWQFSLNKEVYEEKILDIIFEAKKRGWSKAKFYFMVGLPVEKDGRKEEVEIVEFLLRIQEKTRIQCNVNVGTFIPKPHTPYERVRQISPEEAEEKLSYIRNNLPKGRFKVSTHYNFASFLEGMLSRGDERVGAVVLDAYKAGCRLDAWDNNLNVDAWKNAIKNADWDVYDYVLHERSQDEILPWSEVSLGVSPLFFKKEFERSEKSILREKCSENCKEPCGVCSNKQKVVSDTINMSEKLDTLIKNPYRKVKGFYQNENCPILFRTIFKFSKTKGAELIPHLSLIEVFYKAFLRSGLPIVYTNGFNPVPALELAATMSIGITSEAEIASCLMSNKINEEAFIKAMNDSLPEGIRLIKAFIFPVSNLIKRESMSKVNWGSEYKFDFFATEEKTKECVESIFDKMENKITDYTLKGTTLTVKMPFRQDKLFRNSIAEYFSAKSVYQIASIHKIDSLCLNKEQKLMTFFDFYKEVAAENLEILKNDNRKVLKDFMNKFSISF